MPKTIPVLIILLLANLAVADGGGLSRLQELARKAQASGDKVKQEEVVRPLPASVTRLEGIQGLASDPCWGHDSKSILFTLAGERTSKILRKSLDSEELEILLESPYYSADQPDLSPDGRHLAYRSKRHDHRGIWIRRLEDGEEGKLTPDLEVLESSPVWSPTGMKLYFESRKKGSNQSKGMVSNRNGDNLRTLSGERGEHSHPAASPDGEKVAWIHRWGPMSQILISQTRIRTLAKPLPLYDILLSTMDWTADSRRLIVSYAHQDSLEKGFDLGLLDPENGKLELLLDLDPSIVSPRLSPDGSKVVFQSYGSGQSGIMIYSLPDSLAPERIQP